MVVFDSSLFIYGVKSFISFLKTFVNICDNNKKFRSFKSKENIHKKEVGRYRGFD